MYIAELSIENFRCFGDGDRKFILPMNAGLTALVGENDTGKTAVIDALRFLLGTRDQEYFRVEDEDFHWPAEAQERRTEIRIRCKFDSLTAHDKGAFAEYLTYVERDGQTEAVLYVNWTAKDSAGTRGTRRFVSVELRSGKTGDGPPLDAEARNLLRATYLRPLRDAERAMASGRGSRLSQILQHTKEVRESGADYDKAADDQPDPDALSVLGVGDYASALLENREGIKKARKRLNEDYLKPLSFIGDDLSGHIRVNASGDKDMRLRQLLEKLELELKDENAEAPANRGLGSNNLLFMACELLLLGSEAADFPLLLIEEPEAHLHPQRQLRLMQFLQNQASVERPDGQKIQIIVTTHSPNLASTIRLDNLVLIQDGKAFPLKSGKTKLEKSDYRFLERFLDVTKANLFFARGIVIVEGDGENILLPTLARLIGCDFAEHGVSVVNVGHTGLRRFSRIFQRNEPDKDGVINVPVACIADLDVMPDCAPTIIGKVKDGEDWPNKDQRQWRAKSDLAENELAARRATIREKASGQQVETFVADEWTLEYDLAYAGLGEHVWVAAQLARNDDQINAGTKNRNAVETEAKEAFVDLVAQGLQKDEISSRVYALFTKGAAASKAVTAQYLAERLENLIAQGELASGALKTSLPAYLVAVIEHVTAAPALAEAQTGE
ncbi:MAG: AAA family ATPase [Gammaproteobacteria bacterium]|nr:AAA family ATPase [Gammaproteobacteria bacterium]